MGPKGLSLVPVRYVDRLLVDSNCSKSSYSMKECVPYTTRFHKKNLKNFTYGCYVSNHFYHFSECPIASKLSLNSEVLFHKIYHLHIFTFSSIKRKMVYKSKSAVCVGTSFLPIATSYLCATLFLFSLVILMSNTSNAFAPIHKPIGAFSDRSIVKTHSSSTTLFGIGSVLGRVRDSLTSKERSRDDLKIGIAGFYDRSSKLWEEGEFEVGMHLFCINDNKNLDCIIFSVFILI